uniref:upstream-binding factor 1-like protein 1 n=1 Tax=Jaculus jaculus TaxID=51337 RepID=UPI001E1B2C48|nr:upstream-binding factor 1-like protein 1 [Jaculus jaculus]
MASSHNQGHWSTKDTLKLLEGMEENLPPNDRRAFHKTQAALDWGKIAFAGFTGETCRLKWQELSHELRKVRTLSELVKEAKEQVEQGQASRKYKKHPDFPKRPLTAYLRFFKEQRAQCLRMHPELNNKQLARVLSEKYRQLPEQARQRYAQEFQKEREDFEKKVAQFREEHPDVVQRAGRSGVPAKHQGRVPTKLRGPAQKDSARPETDGRPAARKSLAEPAKPPMSGFHKFQQDSWSSGELCYLPVRERMVEIGRRWQRVPPSVRGRYQRQAEEMQQQYWVDLDAWLRTLSPEDYAAYREAQATCGKRKCTMVTDGPSPKFMRRDPQRSSAQELPQLPRDERGPLPAGSDSSDTTVVQEGGSPTPGERGMGDGTRAQGTSSSDLQGSGDEEEANRSSEDSLCDSSS